MPYPSVKHLHSNVKKALKTRKERHVFLKAFNAHAAENATNPDYKEGESFMAGYRAARAHRESLQPKLSELYRFSNPNVVRVPVEHAHKYLKFLKSKGLKAEVVGGMSTGHKQVSDIDIIIRPQNVGKAVSIMRKHGHSNPAPAPIEIYAPTKDSQYGRLKKTLRQTKAQAIKKNLFKGLQYEKIRHGSFAGRYGSLDGDLPGKQVHVAKHRPLAHTYDEPERQKYNSRGPVSKAGYGYITPKGYRRIYDKDTGKHVMEHRVVYGNTPEGHHVHHKDKDMTNNILDNLVAIDGRQHNSMHGLQQLSELISLGEYIATYGFSGFFMSNQTFDPAREQRAEAKQLQGLRDQLKIKQDNEAQNQQLEKTKQQNQQRDKDRKEAKAKDQAQAQAQADPPIKGTFDKYYSQFDKDKQAKEAQSAAPAPAPATNTSIGQGIKDLGKNVKTDAGAIGRGVLSRIDPKYHTAAKVTGGLALAGGAVAGIHAGYKAYKGYKAKKAADQKTTDDSVLKTKYDTIQRDQNRKKMQAVVSGQDNQGDKLHEPYRFTAGAKFLSQKDAWTHPIKDKIRQNARIQAIKQLKLMDIDMGTIRRSESRLEALRYEYR